MFSFGNEIFGSAPRLRAKDMPEKECVTAEHDLLKYFELDTFATMKDQEGPERVGYRGYHNCHD